MELNRGELLAFQPVSPPAQGPQGRWGLSPQSLTTSATGELGTTDIGIWDLELAIWDLVNDGLVSQKLHEFSNGVGSICH